MITAQTLPVSEEESGALRGTELPSLPNDFGDLGLLCAHCIYIVTLPGYRKRNAPSYGGKRAGFGDGQTWDFVPPPLFT